MAVVPSEPGLDRDGAQRDSVASDVEVELPQDELRIFISHRHQDGQGFAAWLQELLAERYGRSNVFRDAGSIQPGAHFPTEIARRIAGCTDVLVLIGPAWDAADGYGRPRLHDPDDWVRLEIEAAIHGGVRLTPLLLGGADLPARHDLPAAIGVLAEMQAYRLRESSFAADARSLFDVLGRSEQPAARQYLGSAKATREERFHHLVHLFARRVEQESVEVSAVPWRRVDTYRAQLNALIDLLEPDEDVVDLALATYYAENKEAR